MSKNLTNQVYLVVNSLSINNITINAPQNSSYSLTLPTSAGTNGQVLTTNGSGVLSWTSGGSVPGVVTSVAVTVPSFLSVTGSPITSSGTIAISGSSTGTGNVVLSTSPTLVTPTLGAASATSLSATGNVSGSTLTSTVSTGTAPFTVTSTTNVTNLNASSLNGATFASPGTIGGTTPGIINASSSVNATNPLVVTNTGSSFVTLMATLFAPNIGSTGQAYMQLGQGSGNGNKVQQEFQYFSANSSSNKYVVSVQAQSFTITNSPTAPFSFNNASGPVAFGAGGISVSGGPLPTAFGGTGTASIGTPGQYAIVNAGATGYSFTTGPGGGGVTSVGLSGDSVFNGIFTISTSSSNPITNSGILTITVSNYTGTGNLVLQTSPTLTTPNIGVASATSLTASGTVTAATLNATGLTASQAVATDGSKNLVSVANTGTGSNVLATSPTLVTPTLGAASATSLTASGTVTAATLNATGLTPSYSVQTDGSKNLVSLINTGTGANVLSTSPILATPTLGVASATAVYLDTNATGVVKICMYGTPSNNFQYDGFATLSSTLAYHVSATTSNHIFYAGTSSTTRSELFRVKGTGGFTSTGDSTVTGNLTISSKIFGGINITTYGMSGSSGWSNASDTLCGNWTVLINSVGSILNSNSGSGVFTNDLGYGCFARITWTAKRETNAFGGNRIWIRENFSGEELGSVSSGGVDWMTTTSVVYLSPSTSFSLYGYQDSGSGNNFQATNSRLTIQLYFT